VTEKTRVLFVSSPATVGADTFIHFLLLKHLDRARFELHAAGQAPRPGQPAPAFDELASIPGVAIRRADFGPSFFGQTKARKVVGLLQVVPAAASFVELVRYIKTHRIQVVHSTDRPRDALACSILSAATGAKAVIHVHVKYGDWMARSVKHAMGRAHAVIGVSDFVARSLIEGGYRAERVHAVLNAIEPDRWDPSIDPAPVRKALGVGEGVPLIVSVARIFPGKGHADLVRAVALVKNDFPTVRLAIVGADYPEGSGTSRELAALASELGASDNVVFTGHRSDVAELMAAADVFALPSYEEPFGLVYAEAMAMKKPVVAAKNGGAPEVVEHGKSGLLAPPGDISTLADHLSTLIRDPALRARMGDHGRAQVLERFVPGRMAEDVARVYAGLVGSSNS
jgi:glycosyltransferase involved in cell wall biosynthesis